MPVVMACNTLVKSMHEHTNTHPHTVACWQVVHAQGNTSLPSTNSPSRLSTSAKSNWSTYAEASTIQTMQHPSPGSKAILKTPISSLLQCVQHHNWVNNRDGPGQTVIRWIISLMSDKTVKKCMRTHAQPHTNFYVYTHRREITNISKQ